MRSAPEVDDENGPSIFFFVFFQAKGAVKKIAKKTIPKQLMVLLPGLEKNEPPMAGDTVPLSASPAVCVCVCVCQTITGGFIFNSK